MWSLDEQWMSVLVAQIIDTHTHTHTHIRVLQDVFNQSPTVRYRSVRYVCVFARVCDIHVICIIIYYHFAIVFFVLFDRYLVICRLERE